MSGEEGAFVYRLGDLLGAALRGEITPREAQERAIERMGELEAQRARQSTPAPDRDGEGG
jgi:hypothetical protein